MSRFETTYKKRLLARLNQLEVLNISGRLLTKNLQNEYFKIHDLLDIQAYSHLHSISEILDTEPITQ